MGAEPVEGGVSFRVWAPRRKRVQVVLVDEQGDERHRQALDADELGYFSGTIAEAEPGDLYWYRGRRRIEALPRSGVAFSTAWASTGRRRLSIR